MEDRPREGVGKNTVRQDTSAHEGHPLRRKPSPNPFHIHHTQASINLDGVSDQSSSHWLARPPHSSWRGDPQVSSKWLTAWPSAFLNRFCLCWKPLCFWEWLAASRTDPGRKRPGQGETFSKGTVIRQEGREVA